MVRSGVDVDIPGLYALRSDLRQLADDLDDMPDADAAAARLIANAGASKAPKQSGALAASGREEGGAVVFGNATVVYAGVIHNGWPAHNIEAHPFATDAAQATEPQWLDIYRRAADQTVERRMEARY